MARLRATPAALARRLDGRDAAALSRAPAPGQWSPLEIVCHLRDVEELFQLRFHTMLAMDAPVILTFTARPEDLRRWGIPEGAVHPLDPDRWAEERQDRRSDPAAALAAFTQRRGEVLRLLDGLAPGEWARIGRHSVRGPLPIAAWAASLAGHDDNHLDQLDRALDGRA